MLALALAITAVLGSNPTTLVLRSGSAIHVDGAVREENGRIVFRGDGTLYSLRVDEVDVDATRARNATPAVPLLVARPTADDTLAFRVSEERRKQLIVELEKNHAGKPAAKSQLLDTPPALPSREDEARARGAEWDWRERARSYEERVRRAREDRDMLVEKAAQLRAHIAGLLSLGYKTSQFTYDTTQLQYTTEQIPYAELEITRAERAYAQFLDDARRQDIPPGWLR